MAERSKAPESGSGLSGHIQHKMRANTSLNCSCHLSGQRTSRTTKVSESMKKWLRASWDMKQGNMSLRTRKHHEVLETTTWKSSVPVNYSSPGHPETSEPALLRKGYIGRVYTIESLEMLPVQKVRYELPTRSIIGGHSGNVAARETLTLRDGSGMSMGNVELYSNCRSLTRMRNEVFLKSNKDFRGSDQVPDQQLGTRTRKKNDLEELAEQHEEMEGSIFATRVLI
ncbi:hypothetical protein BDQ17DRAFT_1325599 [Cyathus striatus]|nr:hypothetical protein BDQ17DRAFT_1325599 [Cyathus striatus]